MSCRTQSIDHRVFVMRCGAIQSVDGSETAASGERTRKKSIE
jgi:hypothetical protein